MHRGLALFVFRLVGKLWEVPLLRPGGKGATVAELAVPAATLEALQRQLAELAAVARRVAAAARAAVCGKGLPGGLAPPGEPSAAAGVKRLRQEPAVVVEEGKVLAIRYAATPPALCFPASAPPSLISVPATLVKHRWRVCSKLAATAAEALLLARKLPAHNVGRLLRLPPAELKAALSHLRLSELLSNEGRRRTTELLMTLLKRHTHGGTLPDALAAELRHGCGTFFPYQQQLYLSLIHI